MPAPPESTRRRLIEAAIHLFAEHGVEGVSLRAAAEAAGARNTAAVHYHFKDREGLLAACIAHIVAAIRPAGLPPPAPLGDPVADLLAAAFAPLMTLALREPSWGASAQRLLARIVMGEGAGLGAAFDALTEMDAADLAARLAPLLQGVSAAQLRLRIDLAGLLLIAAVAARPDGEAISPGQADDLLRFCAAGLRGSSPPA
jgi:AcrR family transcriptional regulator